MPNRCLGTFLILLIFPLIVLSIIFLSTQELFYSSFYKNLFRATDSYAKTAKLINQTKSDNVFINTITSKIDSDWLKVNIETNLDNFFAYVNKDTSSLNPTIDISLFKNDIQKQIPPGVNITIPDKLTFDTYSSFLNDVNNNIVVLEKSSQLSPQDSENIQKQISSLANTKKQSEQNFANAQKGVAYFRLISDIVFLLTFIGLVGIAYWARRWPPAVFGWLGQAIFYPAVFLVIVNFLLEQAIKRWSPFGVVKMSPDLQQIAKPIYDLVLDKIINSVNLLSLILAAIGLIFIIISFIYGYYFRKGRANV